MAPHILLRKLGMPFELLLVDRAQNAQKMTAYLKRNPNGLIPLLSNGSLMLCRWTRNLSQNPPETEHA